MALIIYGQSFIGRSSLCSGQFDLVGAIGDCGDSKKSRPMCSGQRLLSIVTLLIVSRHLVEVIYLCAAVLMQLTN